MCRKLSEKKAHISGGAEVTRCDDNGNDGNDDHLSPSDDCDHVEKQCVENSSEKKAHISGGLLFERHAKAWPMTSIHGYYK
jgi:hypothetical protein